MNTLLSNSRATGCLTRYDSYALQPIGGYGIAKKVSDFEEVVYLVVTSGRYDIMAEVFCRDHADLLRFLTEKLYSIEGVRETESFLQLKIIKEIYF